MALGLTLGVVLAVSVPPPVTHISQTVGTTAAHAKLHHHTSPAR